MTEHTADPGTVQSYVEQRRAHILSAVDRVSQSSVPAYEPLPASSLGHRRREAEELYLNELAWEELTEEEQVAGGHLTELVFPGFLALVDALLLEGPSPDQKAVSHPHPDAVEEILSDLGERYAALTQDLEAGADSRRVAWARMMTAELIDLVLFRLYGLSRAEQEQVQKQP